MRIIRTYIITFGIFMVIDLIWLGVIAKNIYAHYLGYLMRDPINWVAAIVFYLLYNIALLYFSVVPALKNGKWKLALLNGCLFGFFTYMTYDLTNLATINDWPFVITIIDLIWGTILGGLTSLFGYYINKSINEKSEKNS